MREDWIDRWRGILMWSIIVFHCTGAMASTCTGEAGIAVRFLGDQVATFHTRGFFVIAGLLWRPCDHFLPFVMRKAKRLLVPYITFGFVWALLFAVMGSRFGDVVATDAQLGALEFWKPFVSVLLADGWPDGMGFRVINALWFLPCLFLVEMFYYCVDKFITNKYWQLLLLPICFALNQFFFKPDILWSLNLVPRFLACFIIGRSLGGLKEIRINNVLALAVAAVLFCLVCQPCAVKRVCGLAGVIEWFDLARGLCGIGACAMLAQALPVKAISAFGCSTMGVLVTHKVFVLGFQLFHLEIESAVIAITTVVVVSVAVSIASFVSTLALRRWFKWSLGESK